jgi:hypothetical protein
MAGQDTSFITTLITRDWIIEIAGQPKHSESGTEYWDLPIITEHSQIETLLRVHDPCSDGYWPTDLFSIPEGHGVGIGNWPRTQVQLIDLMRVLGCEQVCSRTESSLSIVG